MSQFACNLIWCLSLCIRVLMCLFDDVMLCFYSFIAYFVHIQNEDKTSVKRNFWDWFCPFHLFWFFEIEFERIFFKAFRILSSIWYSPAQFILKRSESVEKICVKLNIKTLPHLREKHFDCPSELVLKPNKSELNSIYHIKVRPN